MKPIDGVDLTEQFRIAQDKEQMAALGDVRDAIASLLRQLDERRKDLANAQREFDEISKKVDRVKQGDWEPLCEKKKKTDEIVKWGTWPYFEKSW